MTSLDDLAYSRRRSAARPSRPSHSLLARLACCCVRFRESSESTDQALKESFFGRGLKGERHGPDQMKLLDDAVTREVGVAAEEKGQGSHPIKLREDAILYGVRTRFQESKSLDQTELLEPTVFNGVRPTVKKKRQGPDHTKLLGDDVLNLVFEFLGKGHYRPVAGACRRFRRIYKPFDVRTSAEELVLTITGARLFYTEAAGKSLRLGVRQDRARLTSWPNDCRTRSVAPLQFIYDTALWNGRLEVVEWTRDYAVAMKSRLSDKRTCALAACSGKVRLLRWARANGCPWDERTCSAAASFGHLNVLQCARANGCPWNFRTCAAAASNGHLAVLQWAQASGCPWDWHTCHGAASNGYLTVLQWARANGCPWDERTCSEAARGGYLIVLQWARANGCPWDERTCDAAASSGHLTVLQWARASGCRWSMDTCSAAASNGHLRVLQWARANGCPWDGFTCYEAIVNGHPNVLEWARANGCPE